MRFDSTPKLSGNSTNQFEKITRFHLKIHKKNVLVCLKRNKIIIRCDGTDFIRDNVYVYRYHYIQSVFD